VQVEDGLARPAADVDGEAVVVETRSLGGLRHELEHTFGFFRGKFADLLEARYVSLGDDEQVDIGLRIDVPYRDEAVACVDVVTLTVEGAEEAIVRQRGFPPP
jgi:hypothetical protein